MMKRDHIIVHHTGVEEKDAAQVKRYHLFLGWRDVGYNYILERDGIVAKGRSLDLPGAHCRDGDMNRRSIGVLLIGNLDNHPPTRTLASADGMDGLLINSDPPPGYTLPEPIGPVVWRVLAGIFRTQIEAENRVRQLRDLGIDAQII